MQWEKKSKRVSEIGNGDGWWPRSLGDKNGVIPRRRTRCGGWGEEEGLREREVSRSTPRLLVCVTEEWF